MEQIDLVDVIRENVKSLSDMSDQEIRDLQEGSRLTEKEFLVYVLNEPYDTGEDYVTGEKIADILDVEENTVWTKKRRAKRKIEESVKTVEVKDVIAEG